MIMTNNRIKIAVVGTEATALVAALQTVSEKSFVFEAVSDLDRLHGHIYQGHITEIAGATGSRLSAVPTDNSAGNFVKIQQRIPVRIDFDGLEHEAYDQMAAGMMAIVKIKK